MSGGFGLVQSPVLGGAVTDSVPAEFRPCLAGGGHDFDFDVRIGDCVVVQFGHDAEVEVAPFAGEIAELVALVPALESVFEDLFLAVVL